MMKIINRHSYLLSTGKEMHPNRGIIGLTETEGLKIYEGYDGSWTTEKEALEDEDIELTNKELKEIALYMSQLWHKFASEL